MLVPLNPLLGVNVHSLEAPPLQTTVPFDGLETLIYLRVLFSVSLPAFSVMAIEVLYEVDTD